MAAKLQSEFDPGSFDHHLKRGVRLAGDLKLVHDDRTQERRFDFFELDSQPFLLGGARDPQAQTAGDHERRQENGKDAGDKERAAQK